MDSEVTLTRLKFRKAGFPFKFVDNAIKDFQISKNDFIIPPNLFEERKTIMFSVPFSLKNEKLKSQFITKLVEFTNNRILIRLIWKTKKYFSSLCYLQWDLFLWRNL